METKYKTRVFVTGLPRNLTSQELSKHFSARHGVTDAHVMPKRRMGFVGFESQDAAEAAVRYFNRSFIRMSRISVDMALPVCGPISFFIPFLPLSLSVESLTNYKSPETNQFIRLRVVQNLIQRGMVPLMARG